MSEHMKIRSGSKMLHPASCASSIRWSMKAALEVYGRVAELDVWITDCDRQIHWSTSGGDRFNEMREKLDAAIKELTKARVALDPIEKFHAALPAKGEQD